MKRPCDYLEHLNKNYLKELQTIKVPPPLLGLVMSSVMILLEKDPSWPSVVHEMKDTNFLNSLKEM
jgi:hypothetical protein